MRQPPTRVHLALAVLASGVLWFASLGVIHVWILAWLVPLPLLLFVPQLRVSQTAFLALGAAGIGSLNFVWAYQQLPLVVSGAAVLGVMLQYCVLLLSWRSIARRSAALTSAVAYPVLVVCFEYLLSLASPHGTAGSTGYSQTEVLPLLQLASITGLWGMSFILALVPSAVAAAWRARNEAGAARDILLKGLLPLVAALVFGATRLARNPSGPSITVGLAAHDAAIPSFQDTTVKAAEPVLRALEASARQLGQQGAQVVVWPEKLIGVGTASIDSVRATTRTLAAATGISLVVGLNLAEKERLANVAELISPDRSSSLSYVKRHLVPGLEARYRTGDGDAVTSLLGTTVGVAICKDLDFSALGRGYARRGVGLMLVPAWDFGRDAWLHSRMAIVRSVEGGYAMARSASEGLLTINDNRGRVIAEATSTSAETAAVLGRVGVGAESTTYARYGDWFAWFCLLALARIVYLAVARPRVDSAAL